MDEEVEKNNGYASQHPEERRFVLESLKSLSVTFKTASTTSIAYVKTFGLMALRKVADRFAGASIGQIATLAVQALLRWLGFPV